MGKNYEVRDPIHQFISFNKEEKDLLSLYPFQRLRDINQLGTSYFIYPSCTHKRFEHSLGTMEIATRIFNQVSKHENIRDEIRQIIPDKSRLETDLRVLRIAALCHDLGHLPFSHSSESLFPVGMKHEDMTRKIITEGEVAQYINSIGLTPDYVANIATGKEHSPGPLPDWEVLLSSIITSDFFGADRIDYLIRDSHHAGVSYGKFDYNRLLSMLRFLKKGDKIEIGISKGGLHSVEALLLARYYLFSQVCYHKLKIIYEIHLLDFLKKTLPGGTFPSDLNEFLKTSDSMVNKMIVDAYFDKSLPSNSIAEMICLRRHFKCVFSKELVSIPKINKKNYNEFEKRYIDYCSQYGEEFVKRYPENNHKSLGDWLSCSSKSLQFFIEDDNIVKYPFELSHILNKSFPRLGCLYLFVDRGKFKTT